MPFVSPGRYRLPPAPHPAAPPASARAAGRKRESSCAAASWATAFCCIFSCMSTPVFEMQNVGVSVMFQLDGKCVCTTTRRAARTSNGAADAHEQTLPGAADAHGPVSPLASFPSLLCPLSALSSTRPCLISPHSHPTVPDSFLTCIAARPTPLDPRPFSPR